MRTVIAAVIIGFLLNWYLITVFLIIVFWVINLVMAKDARKKIQEAIDEIESSPMGMENG